MGMKSQMVLNLLKGKAPKKIQGIYLATVLMLYLVIALTAQALFPESYNILDYTISAQGAIKDNPHGYLIYNVGVIFFGIAIIPHILYMYNHFTKKEQIAVKVATAVGIIASISFSLLGVFPSDIKIPHYIVATIAFTGFLVACFSIFIAIYDELFTKHSCPEVFGFLSLYAILLIATILIIIMPIIDPEGIGWVGDPRLFKFPLWEWVLFLSLIVWFVGMYFLFYRLKVEREQLKKMIEEGNIPHDHYQEHVCFKKYAEKRNKEKSNN